MTAGLGWMDQPIREPIPVEKGSDALNMFEDLMQRGYSLDRFWAAWQRRRGQEPAPEQVERGVEAFRQIMTEQFEDMFYAPGDQRPLPL